MLDSNLKQAILTACETWDLQYKYGNSCIIHAIDSWSYTLSSDNVDISLDLYGSSLLGFSIRIRELDPHFGPKIVFEMKETIVPKFISSPIEIIKLTTAQRDMYDIFKVLQKRCMEIEHAKAASNEISNATKLITAVNEKLLTRNNHR